MRSQARVNLPFTAVLVLLFTFSLMFLFTVSSQIARSRLNWQEESSSALTPTSSLTAFAQARKQSTIPIAELDQTHVESSCPLGLVLVNDTIYSGCDSRSDRHIPRMVHVTAKSRCVTPEISKNLDYWRFQNYCFFFHNEQAVDLLLQRVWPEFPQLRQSLNCLRSGAGKADLWRALVLWEYGGIYTDIDNRPNKFDGETLTASDQAFFVVEQAGVLAQYVMASAPRHPLMWMLVQITMRNMFLLNQVEKYFIPKVTGPSALKDAFIYFMMDQGPNPKWNDPHSYISKYQREVKSGLYVGMHNRTATVVGRKDDPDKFVRRNSIRDKKKTFELMNMTHYSKLQSVRTQESCLHKIFRLDNLDFDLTAKNVLAD